MSSPSRIRILIVDDHAVVRRGLAMVLALQRDFSVVGETGSAHEAVTMALAFQPDLILLDLALPDREGPSILADLRRVAPGARVLALSGTRDIRLIQAAVQGGVDGYMPKDVTPPELAEAIRRVVRDESYIHPDILQLVSRWQVADTHTATPPLTKREMEVLRLMATMATNREIAERLVVSEETVRSHVKSILRKLDQPNRTQAVIEAVRRRLIEV
ncbi:MAG: response regulator transcription factor [Anaerolineae bacterium]|nr:response regulator transcription factor [Caldilineales bacterium]MDW8269699.1 response regulator transcription factor [Anaerolineae bacterium]